MSNAYLDWKKDMEAYTKFFVRDGKPCKGICYTNDYCTDGMNYEFCDLIVNDIVIHRQLELDKKFPSLFAAEVNNELKTTEEIEDAFKVLIVQVGTSSRNPDGTYDEDYEKTLYVFHNDWLMTDGKDLFVVDENYIKEWKEITEEEFVKLTKERRT